MFVAGGKSVYDVIIIGATSGTVGFLRLHPNREISLKKKVTKLPTNLSVAPFFRFVCFVPLLSVLSLCGALVFVHLILGVVMNIVLALWLFTFQIPATILYPPTLQRTILKVALVTVVRVSLYFLGMYVSFLSLSLSPFPCLVVVVVVFVGDGVKCSGWFIVLLTFLFSFLFLLCLLFYVCDVLFL